MSDSYITIDNLTPVVANFFFRWYEARDYSENARKCLVEEYRLDNPDIHLRTYIYNLETARKVYELARQSQREAHSDAHLMLMPMVKGAWFARWRAQIRGARIWKDQSAAFERDFTRFSKFYEEMRGVDPWAD